MNDEDNNDKYEIIEHSQESVDPASPIVEYLLFRSTDASIADKVVIQDKETGETATGWGDSYEEALENAIEKLY